MKNKKSQLERIYERDSQTKAFIILVAIDEYTDVFNDLDPAPFRKRDIDPDLRDFLEGCSSDIPLKHDICICFTIPENVRDKEKEKRIRAALKTYFSFIMHTTRGKIRQSHTKNLVYILASFTLLIGAFFLGNIIPKNVVFSALVEGLYIGGWVFLWEAISSLSFKSKEIYSNYKHYKRFYYAPMSFSYVEAER